MLGRSAYDNYWFEEDLNESVDKSDRLLEEDQIDMEEWGFMKGESTAYD